MQTRRLTRRWKIWARGVLLGATSIFSVAGLARAQVAPGLTVGLSGTNLLIVITNGSTSMNYEIYRTPVLGDVNYPWTFYTNGSLGQTSFVAALGIDTRGYFQAAVGNDWDSDGIPNSIDAQPNNPFVGALTITIDSPTNGANIQ